MKRTKIVATIGPSSSDYKVLLKMAKSGMNVCRLNFSHGSYKNHLELINNIKKVRKTLNEPITIMQDLQGPKIRVSDVSRDGVRVIKDEQIILIHDKIVNYKLLVGSDYKIIPVSFPIHSVVKKNNNILVHDGLIKLRVIKLEKDLVYCKVFNSGIIFPHKGINIPGVDIVGSAITKKDVEDLKFGLNHDIDWVALSFVKDHKDILKIKKLIKKYKPGMDVKVMAKIEKPEAVKDIKKIINISDGIMVARGDLGVELSVEKVPIVQKDIIRKCIEAGKVVVVATQMLESMVENSQPTRAEVSDVANAVIDHADALMLSGETAYGKYPVESVSIMSEVITNTENSPYDDDLKLIDSNKTSNVLALSESVKDLVLNSKAKVIVVATNSGFSAKMISRYRPETPIIALVNSDKVKRQLNISWGIISFDMPKCKDINVLINKSVKLIKDKKIVKKGDLAVIVTGQPVGLKENMNIIKLQNI
ncbi:MAG: pyruvate kinase [Patescibacteria group bacterium]|nr:pyruvate kinase [Patescibacteria group bacterium]MDD4304048.1 pyruvate kinase [Patescibacteria group bacterium]MDD4694925.1 pyruvate kinase [Patescibacteria group bacterium]